MTALSFAGQLSHLKPQKVWDTFEEITKIYRESGPSATNRENNKEISNFLVDKLQNLGFDNIEQVKEGPGKYNVYASRNLNKEKNNAIILQGHMDMVCISDNKDPRKPIELKIDGDMLKANNRTLGADNGIGIAFALAIAEEPQFKDMPLQLIFTVDEETGMYGAAAMKPEDIKGHYLINVDSEKFGDVTIGCAAMDTFKEIHDIEMKPIGDNGHKKVTVELKDAHGGHSGEDINKGRINPIRAALSVLADMPDIKLISIAGGEKANSIPREVKVEMLVPSGKSDGIVKSLTDSLGKVKDAQKKYDPDLKVSVVANKENAPADTKVINSGFQEKLLRILGQELHVGMRSVYDNGDTRTSQNLGILNLNDGNMELQVSSRSSDSKEKNAQYEEVTSQLTELIGQKVVPFNSSPIWQPKEKSPLTEIAKQAYLELGVSKPKVYTCHGGLENAQFAAKRPDIDQISIGPDIFDPHTTKERIRISSVEKFYGYMLKLLEKLKQVN